MSPAIVNPGTPRAKKVCASSHATWPPTGMCTSVTSLWPVVSLTHWAHGQRPRRKRAPNVLEWPPSQRITIPSPAFFLISAGVAPCSGEVSTLLLDDREGNGLERLDADLLGHLSRDLREGALGDRVGLREHDRHPGVAVLSDGGVE